MNSIGIFIPKTNKRYSITEDGIVYSHYKFTRNGTKFYRLKPLKRGIASAKDKSSVFVTMQFGKYSVTNSGKFVFVLTLMEKMFGLKPPDKHHKYTLRPKDGNYDNLSLSNLEYQIKTHHGKWKFYPKPFYSSNGKITYKICGNCGLKKEIKKFTLNIPKDKLRIKTYQTICKLCFGRRFMAAIYSDPKKIKRLKERAKKYRESDKSKKYHKAYTKKWMKNSVENIHPHYISQKLRVSRKDLTPELILLYRKNILLYRTIKKQKNEKPTKGKKGNTSTIKTKKVS